MPFTGGGSPGPERYGGGENNTDVPRLQRIYESLCAQHGSAYAQDWPPATPFGIEQMAYARAICFDLYGAAERMANQTNPQKMTADGLLPRWEKIFSVPAAPGDAEPTRRARVANAFGRLGSPNTHQPIVDVLSAALGPLFGGVILYTSPNSAVTWWPGYVSGGGGVSTPTQPWSSQIDQIDVQLSIPAGYLSAVSGGPNALWWAALGPAVQALDALLPSWIMWTFFVLSSHGTACFYLDEPNLDLEVFC